MTLVLNQLEMAFGSLSYEAGEKKEDTMPSLRSWPLLTLSPISTAGLAGPAMADSHGERTLAVKYANYAADNTSTGTEKLWLTANVKF